MDERDTPALATGTTIDGAVVEGWAGAGGYGDVYRARDRRTGTLLAIKVMPLARARDQARRESSLAPDFAHPNLVCQVGWGLWPLLMPRFFWLKMLFIEGRPLDTWVREENPSARAIVHKLLGVTRGLTVVHERGVVHRDVKEANILVRESDGEPVLVDFGAARGERDSTLTQGMFPPGTPLYRSPEAWRFAREHANQPGVHYRPGRADDLYALGVVFYRMLTGHAPFTLAADEGQSIDAILHKAPLPPPLFTRRVPEALSRVCLRLLEKTPEARYPSALALYEALNELLVGADASWDVPLRDPGAPRRGRPAPARKRPRPVPAWRRFLRRHAGAGAAVLGALALAGGGLVQWCGTATRDLPDTSHAVSPTLQRLLSREMAPVWPPPEAEWAATPPIGERTSAAVTALVARLQDDALKKRRSALSPLSKWCIGVTAAAQTACPAASVRPAPAPAVRSAPAPEDCPEGAWDNMLETLALPNFKHSVVFVPIGQKPMPLPVREGPISTTLSDTWGRLKSGTLLKGRLIFGDNRIYGRFTEAQTPSGDTFKVCMQLISNGEQGEKMARGSTKDHVLLFSSSVVRAVERFE